MQSVKELQESLQTYREQLVQVNALLEATPGDEEYLDMLGSLKEVIELTEDLLTSARQADVHNAVPSEPHSWSVAALAGEVDAQVSEAVPPGRFPVGAAVQAKWSEDGEWYTATIDGITDSGYRVVYQGFGDREEVSVDAVRNIAPTDEEGVDAIAEAEKEAEATKLALKRKIAEAAEQDVVPADLPKKLRILPEDDEETKAAKRKKIHAFKSKARFEQLELTQNKRQNAWQQFQTGKAKQKKVGFFTGRKKESIFKSPEDPKGKVGVIGSGKGLTEFAKRDKHLHMRMGDEEA